MRRRREGRWGFRGLGPKGLWARRGLGRRTGILLALVLAGCSGAEQRANLTVVTDLPVGTSLAVSIAPGSGQVLDPVETMSVPAGGSARFTGLLPGEYQLEVLKNGAEARRSNQFGLVPGENQVTFTATQGPP